MPDRAYRHSRDYVETHTFQVILLLLVALVIAMVFVVLGWNKATELQRRVTSVETQQEVERIGKNIADVTTCFNRAYGRPALVTIFRIIAGVAADTTDRAVINKAVTDYNKSTPTVQDCKVLAARLKVDPKPYIQNPPSEAGER